MEFFPDAKRLVPFINEKDLFPVAAEKFPNRVSQFATGRIISTETGRFAVCERREKDQGATAGNTGGIARVAARRGGVKHATKRIPRHGNPDASWEAYPTKAVVKYVSLQLETSIGASFAWARDQPAADVGTSSAEVASDKKRRDTDSQGRKTKNRGEEAEGTVTDRRRRKRTLCLNVEGGKKKKAKAG